MNLAPKNELSYLTAFFEGRKVVKTQFDRDASRRLATFIYYCNLHAFFVKARNRIYTCKIQLKIDIHRRRKVSCATVQRFSKVHFGRWGSQGLKLEGLLMRNDRFLKIIAFA